MTTFLQDLRYALRMLHYDMSDAKSCQVNSVCGA
jgi:hypothetical protein